ncbi:copper resistance protein CopC [Fontibacillus phaseoli]|uniref:copper resistance protein CopC n=1 Tax=Fontibacillus phaseoli TaxID=1416533 RepID=UPI0015EFDF9D|nr:copper resistance protein CopC [Fontibacillus phaseoli]
MGPSSVAAHAHVVSSSPASNEVLAESPTSIFIQFDESIEPAFFSLNVLSPTGERVDQNNAAIDPQHPDRLVAGLNPRLANGAYTIKWKVVSSDGHPVKGTILFQVGPTDANAGPQSSSGEGDDAPGGPSGDLLVIRWLWYAGMVMYSGTILFHLVLLPRRARVSGQLLTPRSKSVLLLGLAFTAAGIIISLPQQAVSIAGSSWTRVWNWNLLRTTLEQTSFGTVWFIQLLLLLLLAGTTLLLTHSSQARRPLHGLGSLVVAGAAFLFSQGLFLSKAFIGHAAAAEGKTLAIAADYLHLSSSSLWLGGLMAIAFLLPDAVKRHIPGDLSSDVSLQAAAEIGTDGDSPPDTRTTLYWETVNRFSAMAAGCVAVLLLSGSYGALLHIPSLYALFHTGYGLALVAKIVLFLVMLGLALSGFIRGRRRRRPLGRAVWTELALGLVVLALAALLANLPPASTGGAAKSDQAQGQLETTVQGYRIALNVTPNRIGKNQFAIDVKDPSGTPLEDIEQVTLRLTSNEMDMGVIEVVMPGGSQESGESLITMGGSWNINVHILLKTLDTIDHDFTLQVESPS